MSPNSPTSRAAIYLLATSVIICVVGLVAAVAGAPIGITTFTTGCSLGLTIATGVMARHLQSRAARNDDER